MRMLALSQVRSTPYSCCGLVLSTWHLSGAASALLLSPSIAAPRMMMCWRDDRCGTACVDGWPRSATSSSISSSCSTGAWRSAVAFHPTVASSAYGHPLPSSFPSSLPCFQASKPIEGCLSRVQSALRRLTPVLACVCVWSVGCLRLHAHRPAPPFAQPLPLLQVPASWISGWLLRTLGTKRSLFVGTVSSSFESLCNAVSTQGLHFYLTRPLSMTSDVKELSMACESPALCF
jgi:hypothetical protein